MGCRMKVVVVVIGGRIEEVKEYDFRHRNYVG